MEGCRLPTEFEWEIASDQLQWGLWEWTNSAYLAYPGFNKLAGALGEYNGKFMINQMILRGASVGTAKGHSRISQLFSPICVGNLTDCD
jgi:formylglycine-generating enzyme required for sulfatase activity